MIRRLLIVVFALSMFSIDLTYCQLIEKRSVITTDYLIYLPEQYTSDTLKKWPLLIYLYGGLGESSIAGLKKDYFPSRILSGKEYPFVIVTPLKNTRLWNVDILKFLLSDVLTDYRIEENKIYLSGHSMGGHASWEWAFNSPDRFAAIIPVSGCSSESNITNPWKLRNLPIWIFHGEADEIVEIDCNQRIFDALQSYGGKPKFTKYPGVGHDTWEQTYKNEEIYQWLLQQDRRNNVPKPKELSKRNLSKFSGTYLIDRDTAEIIPENGKLSLTLNKKYNRKLVAESDSIFFFENSPSLGIHFIGEKQVTGFKLLSDKIKFATKVD